MAYDPNRLQNMRALEEIGRGIGECGKRLDRLKLASDDATAQTRVAAAAMKEALKAIMVSHQLVKASVKQEKAEPKKDPIGGGFGQGGGPH